MKHYCYTWIDWILIVSLSVALICSLIISVKAYYYNNSEYRKTFSSWQLPMLYALLVDIYIIYK